MRPRKALIYDVTQSTSILELADESVVKIISTKGGVVKLFKNTGRSSEPLQPRRTNGSHSIQPFSRNSVEKHARIRDAVAVPSVCPYCAVGCSQLVHVKKGKIINIEGNPESPINEGTLCPKGANTFQLTINPHRIKHVLYRAPYSDHWEQRPLDWAMD